jgi:DNA-binding response OmpR family regulator
MKANGNSHTGKPAGAQGPCRAGSAFRILVVDDDIAIRLLNADMLMRSGYEVDTAEDGESGWEALQVKNYDLLITDNNMPKVSGVELVKKLHAARMALPVIMASGTIPEELDQQPGLQVAATLLKPFTCDKLLGTVKKALSKTDSTTDRSQLFMDHNAPGAIAEGVIQNNVRATIG